MIFNTFELHQEGSLPGAHLVTYIQEYSEAMAINDRPLILLCPGGGYTRTSDREAEPMALKFLAMGYHAAVLRYSCAPAEYPTSLKELAYSIKFLREHAKEWHIDPHKIVVEGCSAGGHLAASLGVFWDEDFLAESQGLSASEQELLRPDGLLLCYPVITSGEFAHRGSFENLLGSRQEELGEKLSLEKQVTNKCRRPSSGIPLRISRYRWRIPCCASALSAEPECPRNSICMKRERTGWHWRIS